jgi:predicted protein tyrosine phosphatase
MPLPKNFTFYISGRHELKYLADRQINYFIGFNHPGWYEPYTPEDTFEHLGCIDRFYTFEVHDAFTPEHRRIGLKMPDQTLIEQIIIHAKIIKGHLDKGGQINLLTACAAGISRSTAACYIILCYLLGEWNEREALNLIENKRSVARPNPLMVKLADDCLKRGYKMVSPLRNHLDLREGSQEDSGEEKILLF